MEFSFAWFWMINLIQIVLSIYLLYKLYKSGFESKIYLFSFLVLILIQIFVPIKIDGTNSVKTIKSQNVNIENLKELPVKVEDKSFSKEVAKDIKITKEDLK